MVINSKRSQIILILLIYGQLLSGQNSGTCNITQDTLYFIHVKIYQKNNHVTDLWFSSKYLKFDTSHKDSPSSFIKSLVKNKSYCPTLPEAYRFKLLTCSDESGKDYLINNPYPTEIFIGLRKTKRKFEFTLSDTSFIEIKVIKVKGLFWLTSLEEGFNNVSTEYPIDKSWFINKEVFIPYKTSVIKTK